MKTTIRYVAELMALSVLAAMASLATARGQGMEIDLGDIAAGGDGTGAADPAVVGINPDTGSLDATFIDAAIGIGDGEALKVIDDATSEFIDAVFLIGGADMTINSAGVKFTFPSEDLLDPPQTWGQILNARIGGEITPIVIGGTAFEHGVGIHSVAGITFDLDAMRRAHGSDSVGQVTAFAGKGDSSYPDCRGAGFVTAYLILSDGENILDSVHHRGSSGGELLGLPIAPQARFLTLASGAGDARFFCNSGVFAGASVKPPEGGVQKPGDCNQDGRLDISDGVHLLNFLFLGTVPALPCGNGTLTEPGNIRLLDSSGDGGVDLSDGVSLFGYLFLGSAPPVLGTGCVRIAGCPDNSARCSP